MSLQERPRLIDELRINVDQAQRIWSPRRLLQLESAGEASVRLIDELRINADLERSCTPALQAGIPR